jgi:hypothetical protein
MHRFAYACFPSKFDAPTSPCPQRRQTSISWPFRVIASFCTRNTSPSASPQPSHLKSKSHRRRRCISTEVKLEVEEGQSFSIVRIGSDQPTTTMAGHLHQHRGKGQEFGPFTFLNPTARRYPLTWKPKPAGEDSSSEDRETLSKSNDTTQPGHPSTGRNDEVRAEEVQRLYRTRDNRKGMSPLLLLGSTVPRCYVTLVVVKHNFST